MTGKPPDPQNGSNTTENDRRDLLTCIRSAYTLCATPETGNEVDEMTVKMFSETLAEVALAVASRKQVGEDRA